MLCALLVRSFSNSMIHVNDLVEGEIFSISNWPSNGTEIAAGKEENNTYRKS
jgi:hypothetical protein